MNVVGIVVDCKRCFRVPRQLDQRAGLEHCGQRTAGGLPGRVPGHGGSAAPQNGLRTEQQRYLYAPTHLNRTSDYGVTFERGTLIQYGDRNHVLISGTASINNRGEVLHVGDIRLQTLRMWENVEKLLAEGGMTYDNVMQIVVYLRDGADYSLVSDMMRERFPRIPYVITLAPVCRPTWLVEMECVAVKATSNDFPDF